MEIVLLWLDELDDLVFAGFSLWLRLRSSCLAVAMTAAIASHVLPRFGFLSDEILILCYVSLAGIGAWFSIAALCTLMERGTRRLRRAA